MTKTVSSSLVLLSFMLIYGQLPQIIQKLYVKIFENF